MVGLLYLLRKSQHDQSVFIRKSLHTNQGIRPLQRPSGQGPHLTMMEDLWWTTDV